jgi:hypothetical protein
MKMLALVAVSVTVGLLAFSPTAVAFHQAPYHAHGLAFKGEAAYMADVTWTGWGFAPYFNYIVNIHDPLGNVVADETFPGTESLIGGYPRACQWEIFLYGGVDSATHGSVFSITGFQQEIGPTNCAVLAQTMLYEGTYRDYTLLLYVDSPN